MIDAEPHIFDELRKRLLDKYNWAKNVRFVNDFITAPEAFPCVSFCEVDNRTEIKYHETDHEEVAVRLTYQLDVWTNSVSSRKREARKIVIAIDDELLDMGFRRTYLNNDPSIQDASIYRYYGRYTAIVEDCDSGFLIYHRT